MAFVALTGIAGVLLAMSCWARDVPDVYVCAVCDATLRGQDAAGRHMRDEHGLEPVLVGEVSELAE